MNEEEKYELDEEGEGVPTALPPEQEAAFQEAVAQAEDQEAIAQAEVDEVLAAAIEERRPSAQELAFRLGAGARSAAAGIGGGIAAFGRGLEVAPSITPIAGRPFGSPLPVAETPEPEPNELSDLFEVPQPEDNDMYVDDLVTMGEEEEVDDLLEVGDLLEVKQEDIMGRAPAPRFPRVRRPFLPTRGLRGIQ